MERIARLAHRHWLALTLLTSLYTLDQVTKYLVSHNLRLGESWPAESFISITYIFNTGSAFGLFRGQNDLLILGTFLGIGVLALVYRSQHNSGLLLRASLGMQLAGALGNLTDRLTEGHVTDFIDIGPWPIFNVADSSILIGIALLAFVILARGNGEEPTVTIKEEQSAEPPSAGVLDAHGEHAQRNP